MSRLSSIFKEQRGKNNYHIFYRLPGTDEVHSLHSNSIEQIENFDDYWNRDGFVFYPFHRGSRAFFIPKTESGKDEYSCFEDLDAKVDYQNLVEKGKESINKNEFRKVVLARRKKIDYTPAKIFSDYQTILEQYKNAFCYLAFLGNDEIWMGASPEWLLYADGDIAKTVALAGTKNAGQDFTQKEQEEQALVQTFIREKQELLNIQLLEQEDEILSFGKLQHLQSKYRFKANDLESLELLKHLQPTPAVCGIPRDKSYRFIVDNEGFNRDFYAGGIGILGKEKQLFVNLRCAQIIEDSVYLYAGAGITKDSDAEQEFLETEAKMKALSSCLSHGLR